MTGKDYPFPVAAEQAFARDFEEFARVTGGDPFDASKPALLGELLFVTTLVAPWLFLFPKNQSIFGDPEIKE